jgi:Dynein heavy chain, N-terminal region 1
MEYVQKKAAECVYKLFMEEIKQIEEIFESKNPAPMPFSHPTWGGNAIWSYSLMVRANRVKAAIDSLYFIQDHPLQKEALERFRKLHTHLDESISKRKFEEFQKIYASISTTERIE